MIVNILAYLMFCFIFATGVSDEDSGQTGTTVTLDAPVHFITTDGGDILIPTGRMMLQSLRNLATARPCS